MDKEKRIKHLIQVCQMAFKRWDELSNDEKNFFMEKSLELSILSNERTGEILRKNDERIANLEQHFEEISNDLAIHEAFLQEKGLNEEFNDYADSVISVTYKEVSRPKLMLVK
ncbi:hypothetical protein [Pseudogracilibacillus auburnensis]|uniref:hypothetical protein n=1 Tax=Pseudogracilibacillus auburnensis TaxID=1494959 RepID=UPI001A974D62|nr:hypothetical protein [Pseudogracilibacillus auburnensis]MBO1005753.1 hypothetical protein [Pseudogracilibacillus auburnensis]